MKKLLRKRPHKHKLYYSIYTCLFSGPVHFYLMLGIFSLFIYLSIYFDFSRILKIFDYVKDLFQRFTIKTLVYDLC